jgi:hypothetical protein
MGAIGQTVQTVTHRRAVVIFRPWSGDGWPWWLAWLGRVMKRGYGHVSILFWDPDGRAWAYVEPCAGGIAVQAASGELGWSEVLEIYGCDATIAVPLTLPRPAPGLRLRGFYTCVTIVKAVIGDDGWAVTPWQLYRSLENANH